MLFRAIFWIGLVALLMPHARGDSLGSYRAGTSGSAEIGAAAAGDFQDLLFGRLAVVKADIEAAERSRTAGGR